MKTKYQNGFTLYELLITLLIIGAVLAYGVPNLTSFTQSSRISTTANDLHASFLLARSEAARSKTVVTICASNNSMDPDPTLIACAGTFDDGWVVFLDANANRTRDVGENVLRAIPAIDSSINITTNGGSTYFAFASTGMGFGDIGAVPSLLTARMCDGRGNIIAAGGNSAARVLVVTPIGRATVLREVAQVTAQGGCP